jgi:hypothetical protein
VTACLKVKKFQNSWRSKTAWCAADLPFVLRQKSNASGAEEVVEAVLLSGRKFHSHQLSGRDCNERELDAVDDIKYFYIFARIASVGCCCVSLYNIRKAETLKTVLHSITMTEMLAENVISEVKIGMKHNRS